MAAIVIPLEEWREFCDIFSKQHAGCPIMVGTVDSASYERHPRKASDAMEPLAPLLPLRAVTPTRSEDGVRITIEAGTEEHPFRHVINAPVRIRYDQASGGGHQGLSIDTQEGSVVLIRFPTPVAPESLEGVAGADHRPRAIPS